MIPIQMMGGVDALVLRSSTTTRQLLSKQRQPPQEEETKQQQRPPWILLVDDESSIRTAVSTLFLQNGYQNVTTFQDGKEVWELLLSVSQQDPQSSQSQSLHSLPDCIVSDIRMPQMNGLELLERVRQNDRLCTIPLVLLTAKGLTQDRIQGYDAGADAYLSKPFQPLELLAIVNHLIERNKKQTRDRITTFPPSQTVNVQDLQEELHQIKDLLLNKGGAGIGNGFVSKTQLVFLSSEEQTLLELLAQGCMNKEIATHMCLSMRRVEQLLTQLYRKVAVKNRTELIKWAVTNGHIQ